MPLDPKKRAHWAEHHRRWQASGLSQRHYCQRESLSLSSFDRWRRLIGQESDAAAASAAASAVRPEKVTLVPVQVVGNSEVVGDIILQSPAGWQVRLPRTLERETLTHLLVHLP